MEGGNDLYYDPIKYENNIAVIEVNLPIPLVDNINAAVLSKSTPHFTQFSGKLNITVPHYPDDTFSQSEKDDMFSYISFRCTNKYCVYPIEIIMSKCVIKNLPIPKAIATSPPKLKRTILQTGNFTSNRFVY